MGFDVKTTVTVTTSGTTTVATTTSTTTTTTTTTYRISINFTEGAIAVAVFVVGLVVTFVKAEIRLLRRIGARAE